MASLEELRKTRIEKLKKLREEGVNPYPAETLRNTSIADFLTDFNKLSEKRDVILAGRIIALRKHGGSIFIDLYDGTDKTQGYLKEDILDKDSFSLFDRTMDIGDFIEIKGRAVETRRGEKSLEVDKWKVLAKSIRPLPEKRAKLQDSEEKFRKRYLDILMNPDLKELFEKKAKFWSVIRNFLESKEFLEVETPTLEVTTGGAEAKPFKTYHNDFDIDVYLRISIGELWQKRLIASGMNKTFEIGRVYRNEGSSSEHLQEFTNMEFYAAYMDLEEGKKMVKDLFIKIAKEVFGKTKFSTREHTFDLSDDWKELDYVSTIKEMVGIDVLSASKEEMGEKLKSLKISFEGDNRERLTDALWKHCRKQVSGPAFLINHPKLVAPLSKENPKNKDLTEMFQVIIAGSELGRAHAELNDPIDQKKRFKLQQELIEGGDEEAMMPEWDYVEMLEYGMPPTFGFGMGERLFAFLSDKSAREQQIFPLMKPKEND